MQQLELVLQKRKGKSLLYIIGAIALILMSISLTTYVISEFHWYTLSLLIILVIGALVMINGLKQYFLYKEVKLIVTSDGTTIQFYNCNEAGVKFNESEVLTLEKMGRFYVVSKHNTLTGKDYSYAFEGKSTLTKIFKDEVEPFPSLYEAKSDDDRKKVLLFVKSVAPDIELGYENLYERLTK